MKRLSLLLIFVLILFGCSGGGNPIELVKNGTLKLDSSVTVGGALDNYQYFGKTNWHSFEDAQKRTIVQFNGILDFDKFVGAELIQLGIKITADNVKNIRKKIRDIKLTYVAQFGISKSDNTFDLKFSALNIEGKHKETGESLNKNLPDNDLSVLKVIYNNKPEISTLGLLSQS